MGIEIEGLILDENAEPVHETYQGYGAPAQEIEPSLPRPATKRLVGVVFEHSTLNRKDCIEQPHEVDHCYSSFQETFSVTTLATDISGFRFR